MNLLKRIPMAYKGTLHKVRLINFSVEPEEILPKLPKGIAPALYRNRALISMVNVELKNMRPTAAGELFRFSYRHVAFRLLMHDAHITGGPDRGIWFYRSFTDNPLIYQGGRLCTNFGFERASIFDMDYLFELRQSDKYLKYALDNTQEASGDLRLKNKVARLDRAYTILGKNLYALQIHRDSWPIEWIECYRFETNYFETARFEGAFQIRQPVPYHWDGLKKVGPVAAKAHCAKQYALRSGRLVGV